MIGITERGDAARDLSWINKLDKVDGVILITKNIDNKAFQTAALNCKDKAIIHATITGFGGTVLEPNVSPPNITLQALNEFATIFPAKKIVLRIDPIIPTENGLNAVEYILKYVNPNIRRVRFSFIDQYNHIKQRFIAANQPLLPWQSFNAPYYNMLNAVNLLRRYDNFFIESCGENSKAIPDQWKIGCISSKDYDLLNIKLPDKLTSTNQRRTCKCLGTKMELLDNRRQCPNGCLYCYWR